MAREKTDRVKKKETTKGEKNLKKEDEKKVKKNATKTRFPQEPSENQNNLRKQAKKVSRFFSKQVKDLFIVVSCFKETHSIVPPCTLSCLSTLPQKQRVCKNNQ